MNGSFIKDGEILMGRVDRVQKVSSEKKKYHRRGIEGKRKKEQRQYVEAT